MQLLAATVCHPLAATCRKWCNCLSQMSNLPATCYNLQVLEDPVPANYSKLQQFAANGGAASCCKLLQVLQLVPSTCRKWNLHQLQQVAATCRNRDLARLGPSSRKLQQLPANACGTTCSKLLQVAASMRQPLAGSCSNLLQLLARFLCKLVGKKSGKSWPAIFLKAPKKKFL